MGCLTGCAGMELQRIRNARGLKPSQLARLAGHHSVARLLSEAHVAPAQPGGHAFADTHRRSRRSAHARADQLQQQHSQPQQQQQHSRSGSGAPERPQVSQEAVIGAIVQVSWRCLPHPSCSSGLMLFEHSCTIVYEFDRDCGTEHGHFLPAASQAAAVTQSGVPANGGRVSFLSRCLQRGELLKVLLSVAFSLHLVQGQQQTPCLPGIAIASEASCVQRGQCVLVWLMGHCNPGHRKQRLWRLLLK